MKLVQRLLTCTFVIAMCGPAAAETLKVTARTSSLNNRDFILVNVTENGQPAKDKTKVRIERISGDAQLVNPATNTLASSVDLETSAGAVSATVIRGNESENKFIVAAADSSGNKTFAPGTVDLNAGDLAVAPADATDCTKVGGSDQRCRTEVSLYTGLVIDSFAAELLNRYINPNAAADLKTNFVAGVNVEQYVGRNMWLYLETVNAVRSVDVDCQKNAELTVCQESQIPATNDRFLYILRNARSLEALLGFRYEFPPSGGDGRFYLKSQLGLLDVAGAGQDVVDNHVFLAGGFLSADTLFEGSYIEAGVGKSDIFDSYENRRVKFDGFLTAPVGDSAATKWFLQMTVDSDFRSGPDSIQIYLGLDFDLRTFRPKL